MGRFDEYFSVIDQVMKFIENHPEGGYYRHSASYGDENSAIRTKRLYYSIKNKGDFIWIISWNNVKGVSTYKYKDLNESALFTKAELKFLDSNNIKLHESHTEATGQLIEDWF